MSQGYELKSRLAKIERCWPYFIGFGTPLTLLTTTSTNFIVNGCLFGMFFPFFIISSYLADIKNIRSERYASEVPSVHIFWPSLIVTNRISKYISDMASLKCRRSLVASSSSTSKHTPQKRSTSTQPDTPHRHVSKSAVAVQRAPAGYDSVSALSSRTRTLSSGISK
ncbi:unnamed protein product [Anisakis simplex]|uniref:Ectopic P granules protein 4 (inferred by orthology to a C. elegans protein) n=1 Tax=Anisakis simplex TaxID=6269 RepID=A0A0M3J7W7_ANISI|nr:unnamed protein product [Anisakis simplex]